jgi:PleD family two-component response regulator
MENSLGQGMDAAQWGRPHILAIDDTPINLAVLVKALRDEFSVQLASSGAEGLALASASPPQLVLLDIMMPGMDGYETCRRFKSDPKLAHIPIIFISALTDGESEVRGLELGAEDYLFKPVNMVIAKQRIRNLLERKRVTEYEDWLRATMIQSDLAHDLRVCS